MLPLLSLNRDVIQSENTNQQKHQQHDKQQHDQQQLDQQQLDQQQLDHYPAKPQQQSVLDLLDMSMNITGVESPTSHVADRLPRFVCLPEFKATPSSLGRLSLWHFPSERHLTEVSKLGCNVIVTLQGESENSKMNMIPRICKSLDMEWIQLDFWTNYYSNSPQVVKLVESIVSHLRSGHSVLIHCAAGIHRTGICVYAVLRRMGYSSEETLSFICKLRKLTFERCGMDRFRDMERKMDIWFKE